MLWNFNKRYIYKKLLYVLNYIIYKGGGLNANISQYLTIKYTTEAYICAKIAYYVRNQLNNCNI